jgi:hypothetical protein
VFSAFCSGIIFYSSLFYLPQFFQIALGYSPIQSGVFLLPVLVTQTLSNFITVRYQLHHICQSLTLHAGTNHQYNWPLSSTHHKILAQSTLILGPVDNYLQRFRDMRYRKRLPIYPQHPYLENSDGGVHAAYGYRCGSNVADHDNRCSGQRFEKGHVCCDGGPECERNRSQLATVDLTTFC